MKQDITNGAKIAVIAWLAVCVNNVQAQVRIGPASGGFDGSATFDVKSGPYSTGSPYRGLLTPTVTTPQRAQIQNPAKGLLIFNTTTNQIEVNTGTTTAPIWTPGGTTSSGGASASSWNLTGNAGTNPSTNFIGTVDNVPLNFRVNNQNAGRIDQFLNNVALGYLALSSGTTGQGNIALGTLALANATTGNYNTASGLQALQNNTTGSGNTALGSVALLTNTTGQFNTASGYRSLYSNISGTGNTAVGAVTLENNTTGDNNTAVGQVALQNNSTGARNTALGAGSLRNNVSGYENQAIGQNAAASNTTGISNTAIGTDALYTNTAGSNNVALGGSAMLNNTTGNGNVATGDLSLRLNTIGTCNTANGLIALQYNTTGSYNTALGYNAGPPQASPNLNNSTAIGANAIVSASNTIVLGDNQITALRCNVQTISSLSDKRIKDQVRANVPGLNFITKLTPVTYYVNKVKEAELVGYSLANVKKDTVLHSGFLAQDVEKAAKAVGYNFEGVRQEDNGKYYTLGYTLFVIPLVQAVKDLNTEVELLKARLKERDEIQAQLIDQVKQMQNLLEISPTSVNTARK
ncbi:tail fiber domain-containing protein [Spirosoma koreense]